MTPPKIEKLKALIAAAEAHESQSLESQKKSSDTRLEVGRALIQIKNSLPHGQWQKWHDENIRCKLRTTQKWMRLAALEDKPTPSKAPSRTKAQAHVLHLTRLEGCLCRLDLKKMSRDELQELREVLRPIEEFHAKLTTKSAR
jgi:hypothetical protein